MSYFMTIAGRRPNLDDFAPTELVPVAAAQPYIRALERTLVALDGAPVLLVHDGASGTSHAVVAAAEEAIHEHESLIGTVLWALMQRLATDGATFRIWWASQDPQAYAAVTMCSSLADVGNHMSQQVRRGQPIAVRFAANQEPR